MNTIAANLSTISEKVLRSCQKRGIAKEKITILAATKTMPVETIQQAILAGITHIGENRVQEAGEKFHLLPRQIEKHMIGHLQKNKVRKALTLFDVIQSVDSVDLGEKINTIAGEYSRTIPVFIEVNVSREKTKYGFVPEEAYSALQHLKKLQNITISGLMTLGKYTSDQNEARILYKETKHLFDTLVSANPDIPSFKHLSMGMSHDYDIAIEEGATMIRVGTALFGERKYI